MAGRQEGQEDPAREYSAGQTRLQAEGHPRVERDRASYRMPSRGPGYPSKDPRAL